MINGLVNLRRNSALRSDLFEPTLRTAHRREGLCKLEERLGVARVGLGAEAAESLPSQLFHGVAKRGPDGAQVQVRNAAAFMLLDDTASRQVECHMAALREAARLRRQQRYDASGSSVRRSARFDVSPKVIE